MESREPLAKPEEQLWSALAAVMHTVPQALESHMRSAVRMTTTEYRALGRLRWAGSGGLRVKALAEELGLSTSGAARIGEILVAAATRCARRGRVMTGRVRLSSVKQAWLALTSLNRCTWLQAGASLSTGCQAGDLILIGSPRR
ncbi:MAG: hypothetical protein QOE32_3494 [Pseudonocardiales bacterium]|nr:hypothetical protein [Pseudonocardiales bacterium]